MSLLFNLYQHPVLSFFTFLFIIAWSLLWQGLGLWQAGKNQQKGWFIAILLVNTLGLLPLIYLIWFRLKEKPHKTSKKKEVEEEIDEDDL